MSQKRTFKIILVGDGGVGKTALIRRHQTGEFREDYIATMGVEVHPLEFKTSEGSVTLNIWDCAGKEEFRGLEKGYYTGADGAILMFDVEEPDTYGHIPYWYKNVKEMARNAPMVLCGNKVDSRNRRVKPSGIKFHKRYAMQYYDISARSNYNFEKPFLFLIREMMNKPDLVIG
jgi:GTP-binding nuclear protein Ran